MGKRGGGKVTFSLLFEGEGQGYYLLLGETKKGREEIPRSNLRWRLVGRQAGRGVFSISSFRQKAMKERKKGEIDHPSSHSHSRS